MDVRKKRGIGRLRRIVKNSTARAYVIVIRWHCSTENYSQNDIEAFLSIHQIFHRHLLSSHSALAIVIEFISHLEIDCVHAFKGIPFVFRRDSVETNSMCRWNFPPFVRNERGALFFEHQMEEYIRRKFVIKFNRFDIVLRLPRGVYGVIFIEYDNDFSGYFTSDM